MYSAERLAPRRKSGRDRGSSGPGPCVEASDEGVDGVASGTVGADGGLGGAEAGQVHPRLVRDLRALHGDAAQLVAECERVEMAQGGFEAGGPQDRVYTVEGTVGLADTGGLDRGEHRPS